MTQILSKKELAPWIGELLKEHSVVAPAKVGDLTLFRQIASAEEVALDYETTVLSPKDWFFRPTDTLFTLERKDGDVKLQPTLAEEEFVVFGLHPCDAMGLALIDRPFLADPPDALYAQRRAKATLVGLACLKPCPQCFCTSMGGAPNDPSNVDLLLTKVEEGYIVETVTDKGKALLEKAPLREGPSESPAIVEPTVVPVEGLVEAMSRFFEHPYWSRVADRCIHCNICTYVCPTCYCFNIRDYTQKNGVERLRSWDSCQSKWFTKLAGGYNPRDSKLARMRQRFYHKLYYFPKEFGPIACVGCGRCVKMCPVNIDIREIIADVQKLGEQSVSRTA